MNEKVHYLSGISTDSECEQPDLFNTGFLFLLRYSVFFKFSFVPFSLHLIAHSKIETNSPNTF